MGSFRPLRRERLVVELLGGNRVKGQCELVSPPELKTRLGQGVVAFASTGVTFRQVGRVRRDFVGDHTRFHVVPVG